MKKNLILASFLLMAATGASAASINPFDFDQHYVSVGFGLSQINSNPATYSRGINGQLARDTSNTGAVEVKVGGFNMMGSSTTDAGIGLFTGGWDVDFVSVNSRAFAIVSLAGEVVRMKSGENMFHLIPHVGFSNDTGLATGADIVFDIPSKYKVLPGQSVRVSFTNYGNGPQNLDGAGSVISLGLQTSF